VRRPQRLDMRVRPPRRQQAEVRPERYGPHGPEYGPLPLRSQTGDGDRAIYLVFLGAPGSVMVQEIPNGCRET
jgi:hypothetical protein